MTEGSQGMTHYSAKRKASIHRDAIAQDVIDVTGAGDTALAAFVLGRARGWKTEGCMDFANAAAGMVCGMMGTHVASDIPRREIGRAHSELQSHHELVCRLMLEKKKKTNKQQQRRRVSYEKL